MATMDTLAALGWSRCATGAGAASHVEAPARLVAQHQNLAKERTVLALLSHGYLPYCVVFDAKLLETSRGLGTRGAGASRHRGQQRATGGESKERSALDRGERKKSRETRSRRVFGRRSRL